MKDGDSREQVEIAVFSLLETGLDELGVDADAEQVSQLTRLVSMVSEWAGRISLTGHRDPIEMARRLVLDAAALSQALPELSSSKRLADLGSGVGFPGLPIAILRPDLEVVLVESRQKRHHLQREARRQLGLTRVVSVHGRSDEVEIQPSDVVVAQAMAKPMDALALMKPWTRAGGLVALPVSDNAKPAAPPAGFADPEIREYRVPQIDRVRKIWVLHLASR
jgi:16S rRNA (guanine527-N7)-methyltransferase